MTRHGERRCRTTFVERGADRRCGRRSRRHRQRGRGFIDCARSGCSRRRCCGFRSWGRRWCRRWRRLGRRRGRLLGRTRRRRGNRSAQHGPTKKARREQHRPATERAHGGDYRARCPSAQLNAPAGPYVGPQIRPFSGIYPGLLQLPGGAPRALTVRASAFIFRRGEMTERPKVPDSKSGVPVRVPRVRIPFSPPLPPHS